MKKVVLLAGAVAAGMAIAPQAANAAAPNITADPYDGSSLSDEEIKSVKSRAEALAVELETFKNSNWYKKATSSVAATYKTTLTDIISHLLRTAEEAERVSDSDGDNSYYFDEKNDGYSRNGFFNNGEWKSIFEQAPTINPGQTSQKWIDDYAAYENGLSNSNSIVDLVNLQEAKSIEYRNKILVEAIKADDSYKHLKELRKVADGIFDENNLDPLYADATYSTLKNVTFKVAFKEGAYASAVNLLKVIDDVLSDNTVVVNPEQLLAQVVSLYPTLETQICEFKKQANTVAYNEIDKYVKEFTNATDGKLTVIKNKIQHHLDAKCFSKENHKIASATDVTTEEAALSILLGGYEPDTDWNGYKHEFTAKDRALNDPKAVKMWKEIQDNKSKTTWESKTDAVDIRLTKIRTAIYQTCLAWDKADIEEAIKELNEGADYLGHSTNFKGGSVTVKAEESKTGSEKPVSVESELKQWLKDFLTKYPAADNADTKDPSIPYIEGSVADMYWDRFHDGTTTEGTVAKYMKGNMSVVIPDDFDKAEAAVNVLANTIANVKANWTDIVTLDNDLVARRLEMEAAAEKNGYDSDYIAGLWGTKTSGTDVRDITIATEGEWGHHESLRKSIKKAINDINDTAASTTTKAGAWVGYTSFAGKIALEEAHHSWLDNYQLENYQAKEEMLAAIAVRNAEYEAVKTFKLEKTHSSETDVKTLADGTKVYTTETNKNVALYEIKGENDNTKSIYYEKFFKEIDNHFGNNDGNLNSPTVSDSKPVDLMNDRIKDWYEKGEAKYIEKTFQAGWETSKPWLPTANTVRQGELKNNTVEGLQLTKDATLNPTGILVMDPAKTTTGNEVVFGWLQQEIQKAFKDAVENEKANKDLHEAREAVEKYIKDAQDDIDTYAQLNFNASAKDINVYKIDTRTDVPYTEPAINFVGKIDHDGAATGVTNYNVVALADTYYKEGGNVDPTAATVDYKSITGCGHEPSSVWGWTVIGTNMTELQKLEKKEYDKIASKKLLDGTTPYTDTDSQSLTYEETLTKVKENVDDITNEAYTQMVRNGLAYVQQTLNAAKVWAKGVDGVCDETQCATLDITNNPCGWDAKTPQDALKQIIADWNEQLTKLGTAHNAETADNHKTAEDNFLKFQAYVTKALADVRDWQVKFAEADKKHKQNLNDALDQEKEEAHTLHHYAEDANHDAASFTDADEKAANLWAQDFNLRLNDTNLFDEEGNLVFKGEKITFQTFMDRLLTAVGHGTTHPDPDKLANAEKVAANGITCFNDYIEAMDCIEELLNTYAKNLYDKHLYTDLKNLSQGLKDFNLKSDYMEAINANNAAFDDYKLQLAVAQAALEAASNDVDANKVYRDDYIELTDATLTDAPRTTAQNALTKAYEDLVKCWNAGQAAKFPEGITNADPEKAIPAHTAASIDKIVKDYEAKVQEAERSYADNLLAKEELLAHYQAVLTVFNTTNTDVDNCGDGSENLAKELDDIKKKLVGGTVGEGTVDEKKYEDVKDIINNAFKEKKLDKCAPGYKYPVIDKQLTDIEKEIAGINKKVTDHNAKVIASGNSAKNLNSMIDAAFDKDNGAKIKEAQVTGYENFKERAASPAITLEGVMYFDEIGKKVEDLKNKIKFDNSHEGGHVVAENYAKYLQTMDDIQKDLDKLVQAIKDNETAHNAQIEQRNKLYKKYECYDTTGLEAAVNFIKDPDFTGVTGFPEVPGYPETPVAPGDNDHTKAHTAVADAIKALDAEIEKHYKNGASNVEAAKTKIGEKETAYTTAFQHAKTNDSKFMEEYGKCKEADKDVVNPTPVNWMAAHFENGVNKYSDEANDQVTNAYKAIVAARKAYLADIKKDWYNNEAVEKKDNNAPLLNTYKEKITAYNTAVDNAKKNDEELKAELGLTATTPDVSLPAAALEIPAEYNDAVAYDDATPELQALIDDIDALSPKVHEAKYNTIKADLIKDWEDDLLWDTTVAQENRQNIADYKANVAKYNQLVALTNEIALVEKAYNEAKAVVNALAIMNDQKQTHDETPAYAAVDKDKSDIVTAANNIKDDIKKRETQIDEWYDGTRSLTAINAKAAADIQTAVEDYQDNAEEQNELFVANENAFDGRYADYTFEYEGDVKSYAYGTHATGASLYDNMLATKAKASDDSFVALSGLAKEAYEKFVTIKRPIYDEDGKITGYEKSLREQLDDEKAELLKQYKAENAVNFDVRPYEALKAQIDYAYDVALAVGEDLGDVTADHNTTGDLVNEYDFMYLLEEIILKNVQVSTVPAENRGDLDLDGEYTVADLELLDNIIWYKNLDGVQRAQANRGAFEAELNAEVVHNTVAIAIDNNYEFKGLQFDVTVPEGAKLTDLIATTRAQGLVVASNKYAENTYRVVIVGMGGDKMISGNEGNLVSFNIFGAEGEVEIFNVKAANGVNYNLNGASLFIGQTTGIDEVAAEGETDIFSLDGIRQGVMKAGVNIVRGANGVAKKIFNK